MKSKYDYKKMLSRLINRDCKSKSLIISGLLLLMFTALQAQEIVKGIVRDDTGEPLPGAYIESESGQSAETDANGKYTITAKQGEILTFSFIGKNEITKKVSGTMLNVVLRNSEATQIGEVVVTALGIKREKKALGYAVQDINPDELKKTGNPDLAGALQGKVTGIDIKPSSGMPGASSQIVIRGARSFNGNNTPLYVVDGMPITSTPDIQTGGDISQRGSGIIGPDIANRGIDIDPNDIVSLTVLKGQAAAALYGMRASNGAVIITTRNGKGLAKGKPVVTFNQTTSFDMVSRTPDYQTTWAQGIGGKYSPRTSTSWGPRITDLPNDPTYGGNGKGHEGMYKVPQLEEAGLDPWVTPGVYNNWNDYFNIGLTSTTGINVAQATENGHFSIGLGRTNQTGIAHNTGMKRWNAKAAGEHKLNNRFTAGFSANFVSTMIDKLSGGNDNSLAGVLTAPSSYNLKGIPYHDPKDPYKQIYYRGLSFDNPYWVEHNNTFNEHTDRFFGNGFVRYTTHLADDMDLNVKYQLGLDSYTTNYQDIFGFGSKGKEGRIKNYGVTNLTWNSLLTANYDWKINHDLRFNAILGNEINHNNSKAYQQKGQDFNFGGWNHINNAKTVTNDERQEQDRSVGFFGSFSLSWKEMLFLNATGRNDIVSSMPRGNRSFFYPSASLGFVASEINGLKNLSWLSFVKFRASYAEVGQAGTYYDNFFVKPDYEGGFWTGAPILYPLDGVSSYIASSTLYDPNLKPQNTKSYEFGVNLKFLRDRIGIDYTYSRQNVKDQIFPVPLAGSTGAQELVTNGGKVHTDGHEVILYITPIRSDRVTWDMNVNFSKIKNVVDELAPGESIYLGGFDIPQVRAGIGDTYPVIYGSTYKRDKQGRILVDENPDSDTYGMPMAGEPGVIGQVSPDFIVGLSNTFRYREWTLGAVLEWKQGGQICSGSNQLLDYYGMSKKTEDRSSAFIYDGYKKDGSKNDIVRGGDNGSGAYQTLYTNVLYSIDEASVYDNSFIKIRELSLKYDLPKKLLPNVNISMGVFVRNLLLWAELDNIDPESSLGNTNMAGGFDWFTLPQTTSYGITLNLKF